MGKGKHFYSNSFREVDISVFDIPVNELELPDCITLNQEASIIELVGVMQKHKIGAIPLVDDQSDVVGIVSERDLLLKVVGLHSDYQEMTLKDIMTANPISCTKETTIKDCIILMTQNTIRHIPVVENKKAVKILSVKDILRYVIKVFGDEVTKHGTITEWSLLEVIAHDENFSFLGDKEKESKTLSGGIFMTPLNKLAAKDIIRVDISTSAQEVLQIMQWKKVPAVAITEYETKLLGIITERDFLLKIFGKYDLRDNDLPIKGFMTPEPHTMLSRHIIAHALNNMFSFNYRNIIEVDEEGYPIGLLGLYDVFSYISHKIYPESFDFS